MSRGLSEKAHQQVLQSAAELFADRGIDGTSMDAIASVSGVSKATIYKHWADKEALCMEMLVFVHKPDEEPPKTDSGDWKADVIAFLTHEPSGRAEEVKKRLMPHLIAYSARNEEVGRAWRARAIERVRTGLKELVRRGIDDGIFPTVLDEELAVALLVGPMMFRHIFSRSLDKEWLARGAVASFWNAHARKPSELRSVGPGASPKTGHAKPNRASKSHAAIKPNRPTKPPETAHSPSTR
jgi:AcrR family transcriptional regulator